MQEFKSYVSIIAFLRFKWLNLHPSNYHLVIQLNDRMFDVFLTEEQVLQQVRRLGAQLSREYMGKDLILMVVLSGSFMFASDLMKHITIPCEISFVKVNSYSGINSRGQVDELIGLQTDISKKDVVIIEDIVDSGVTIDKIFSLLDSHGAFSVRVCTLLFKPEAFTGKNLPEYIGFSIPKTFVVGYGLDYNEKGRNLNAIYQLKES
jgi:hypoxanthine phosphoribosyltransferase